MSVVPNYHDIKDAKTVFWAYDFFGYLLPGLLFIFGLFFTNPKFHQMWHTLKENPNWFFVLTLIGTAYILGHFIAALSSVILEKILIVRILKYPSDYLLDTQDKNIYKITKKFKIPYVSTYSKEFIKQFLQLEKEYYGQNLEKSERYWVLWSFIQRNHEPTYRIAFHFVELTGLYRNICLCLMFFYISSYFWFLPDYNVLTFRIICLISIVTMFFNYLKMLKRNTNTIYSGFYDIMSYYNYKVKKQDTISFDDI
jgi:hypothetical protein